MPEIVPSRRSFLGGLVLGGAAALTPATPAGAVSAAGEADARWLVERTGLLPIRNDGATTLMATSPVAWGQAATSAQATPHHDQDPHESILRDAAMVWKRLPSGWQTAPFLGNAFLAAHVYPGRRTDTRDPPDSTRPCVR
jgi:hypothetical protein